MTEPNRDREQTAKQSAEKRPGRAAEPDCGCAAPDFRERADRVGKYLLELGSDFVFDQFNPDYLEREGLSGCMSGVPIPLRRQDVVEFHGQTGLPVSRLAENMAQIMGINPQFPHVTAYIAYIRHYFNEKIVGVLTGEGAHELAEGKAQMAAVHFRAALVLSSSDRSAMYGYAAACRELYLAEEGGEDEAYVGCFKAEATEYFELCTECWPTFAEPWYYLGYVYLNMGLYRKAALAWRQFLKYAESGEEKDEIRERMDQLTEPIKIEEGCNHVAAGRFGEGIDVLLPYRDSDFADWWPLHYYLGVAFARIGEKDEALGSFLRTLSLSPANEPAMEEMIAIYQERGDLSMAEKYKKKLELLRRG